HLLGTDAGALHPQHRRGMAVWKEEAGRRGRSVRTRRMRYLPVPSAAVVAGIAVVLGVVLGSTTAHMQDRTSARTRVYTAALAAIETDYVEPMPEVCSPSTVCGAELLIYGSIDGMLRTLD